MFCVWKLDGRSRRLREKLRRAGKLTLLFLLCVTLSACSSGPDRAKTSASAETMAVEWCRDKYGIEVNVVSVSVGWNSPIGPAFEPTGNGGYTSQATVTVRYGDEEFAVHCDTATRDIYDLRLLEEIQQAEIQLLSDHLGLNNLLRCTYNQLRSDRTVKYREFDGGNMEEILTSTPMRKPVLLCVGEDLSHIRAEDLLGEDCPYNDFENSHSAVIISYRSAEYLDAIAYESLSPPPGNLFVGQNAFLIESALILERSGDDYTTEYYEVDLQEWEDGILCYIQDDLKAGTPLGTVERNPDRLEYRGGYEQLIDLFEFTISQRSLIYFYIPVPLMMEYQDYSQLRVVTNDTRETAPERESFSYFLTEYSMCHCRECDGNHKGFSLCEELCADWHSCNYFVTYPYHFLGKEEQIFTVVGIS